MRKYLKWIPLIIAVIFFIKQEELYFKTIWEINALLPSLILFIVLLILYLFILKLKGEKKLNESKYVNTLSLGIIATLSSSLIYMLLYINILKSETQEKIVKYKISNYDMMSGGKYSDNYPSIVIDTGKLNKRLPLKKYKKEYVYSKKEAILTIREGYLGWPIIDKIILK